MLRLLRPDSSTYFSMTQNHFKTNPYLISLEELFNIIYISDQGIVGKSKSELGPRRNQLMWNQAELTNTEKRMWIVNTRDVYSDICTQLTWCTFGSHAWVVFQLTDACE